MLCYLSKGPRVEAGFMTLMNARIVGCYVAFHILKKSPTMTDLRILKLNDKNERYKGIPTNNQKERKIGDTVINQL